MLALNKMVGIEISGHRLRFAAVQKNLHGFAVTHAMTLDDYDRSDPLSLRPGVDDFYRRARVEKSHTVLALPRSGVVLRTLKFPAAVLGNLNDIIDYQVENYEPIDRTELAYAHQRLDGGHSKKPRGAASDKLEVLLVMTRRSEMEGHQKMLQQLDIRPRGILCESLGLAGLMRLSETTSRENVLLVRQGESDFELIAISSGRFNCSRRFEGEAAPKDFQRILQELERVLAEFHVEAKDVHNIFVLGPEAEKTLASLRALAPSLPWHPLRPPASLGYRLPAAEFGQWAAAIGAAVSAMQKGGLASDLMDHGEEVTPSRWMWVPTYALGAAALLMVGAGAALPYFQQHQFIQQLDAEIPRLQPRVRQVERLESDVDGLQKKAAVLEVLQANNARTLEALRELSEILPDTAWITDMNLRADGMEISGFADSATALIPLLEQSSAFQDVALASGITRNQQGKELFRIRAKFKY